MKKFIILLFLLFLSSFNYSQVNLNIILRTPTPSSLSEWQTDPSIVQIVITNQSTQSYPNSFISFSIINEQNVIVAQTNDNDPALPRINIPSGPSAVIFNGPQIFNVNAVSFDPTIRNIAAITNSIPEGNYQFCVRLFDAAGNNLSSTGEICTNFFVMIPDPPTLITPIENEIITNPFPNFIWTPVTNVAPGTVINYKIKISPIFNGQTPRTAIESNPVLLEKNNIQTTSYLYLPSDLPFNYFPDAIGFVWIVQAFNQFGLPATRNEGKSELGTFRFGGGEPTSMELTNVFPADNDTLPWSPPFLIARFSPYSDDIRTIRFTLKFRKEGNSSDQIFTRTLNFPTGPMNSQGLTSQDKASLLFVNVDSTRNIVGWMQNLEEGKKYFWSVTAELTKSNGENVTVNSSQSSFVYGLRKPELKSPANDSSIVSGRSLNIRWQIPQPSQLNFNLLDVLQSPGFHAYGSSSNAKAKFKVEFSKQNSFDSIYNSKIYQIPFTGNYNAGSNCDSLFSEISKSFPAINDTGSFYWRLKYLKANDEAYFTSEVRKLNINPVTSISCFEMNVQTPQNFATISNTRPKFSVSIKPQIRKSAITGGRIKIWSMQSRSELPQDVKSRTPVLDTTFSGNDNAKIFAYSTDMSGFTRYDLNFINADTGSVTFTADTNKHYLWNFTLNFNKDSIRTDGMHCDSNFVVSSDGIFSVSSEVASDSNACAGDCIVSAPTNTTISTETFAQDTVIKIGQFNLKLKSVSGSAASLSGEGEIDIPFLHTSFLVEFNGLKVNTDNQVFDGEVYAKIVDGAPYSAPEGNDFEGQALSFAADKLKFKAIHEFSGSLGRLVSGFAGGSAVGLPVGFDKDFNGHKVVIGIIGMKFTPTQAVLNAAMYVELPELGPDVGFGLGAKNICFHKDGISGISSAKLYLAQDFGYRNEGTWSILLKAPTPSDPGTYATWDCEGFKDLFISAEVDFPPSWLKPTSGDTTRLVKAKFFTRAEKSGNGWQWMASANLEECEITSAPGFKLLVQDMVFDYSSVRNPETISFPSNYRGTTSNEWKGFFIRRASLIFPDKLRTFENENPLILVNNLLIDRTGFTASMDAANIIQYPRGNFGEWGASIDSVKFNFISSSLEYGLMKGRIKVPIFDSLLVYSGTIGHVVDSTKLNYQFLIYPPDTISTSWKIKFSLYPTSRIELTDTSGKFNARAILSGSLSLTGNLDALSNIGFSGITFQNYGIQSNEPHFIEGTYSWASPQHSLSGFPITISDIDIITGVRGGKFAGGFKFTIGVNLQPGSNAISGNTTLKVWAKMNNEGGPQSFSFDGIELESISINADLGAVRINGAVNLYNSHPTYGNGFRGAVEAVFVNQFSVSATAQFGSVNDFRYWYVDAKALMPTGAPIFSGVGIYGFGGGAWYHMRKTGETNLSTPPSTTDTSSTPGRTNSGYTYTPDSNINFGFRATVILGTHPSPDAFNSDVSLEAEFLSGGGISRISILGDGYMLCSITNRPSAKVRANVNMEYNFPTSTFHGVFTVNINATPFTGGGQMVLHFAPDLWFIKIGEPSNRIALNLANWLSVNGYFMVGMNLPAPPDLPTEIQSLFPTFKTQPRNPAIQQGNGFAFGAQVDLNTGRKTFLIFYGQARFLGGYDMALLNYGPGTTCEGISGTIGVNGWYAMGQIYVYANASIGLHVDLWFVEGDFEILNLAVGAALQGAGPNPTWIKGAVGGRYRILGGAVKGTCNFEFKLGTECIPIVESPLARIDLISDINPSNGSTNVDVFTEPQVAMNFELNTPFELQEMPTSSQPPRVRIFRIKLRPLTLNRRTDNQIIAGNTVISQDKYSAYLSPYDVLGSRTQYKFKATAFGEELISGVWQAARRNDGSVIEQSVETNFTTGDAPNYIPQNNVAYTYPLNGNKYFLQDECRNGIVQLITGQPDLFIPRSGYNLELIARFIPLDFNLQPTEVPFTYNNASRTVNFSIPQLQNNKAYFVQIIKKEVAQTISSQTGTGGIPLINLGQGIYSSTMLNLRDRLMFNNPLANVFVTERKISASRVRFGEKLLYVFYFKTSQFNTLQEKLATFNYLLTEVPEPFGNYEFQKAKYSSSEAFDYFDFQPHLWQRSGNTYRVGPLVKVTAIERTTSWHNNFANPFVYDQIQWMRSKNFWSGSVLFEQAVIGTSSTKLVEVENPASPPNISDVTQMIYSGTVSTGSGTTGGYNISGISNLLQIQGGFFQMIVPPVVIKYNHGMVVPTDFINLKLNALATIISSMNPFFNLSPSDKTRLNQIYNRNYQMMYRGNYPLKFYYNYWGCRGPDDPTPTYSKWFVY